MMALLLVSQLLPSAPSFSREVKDAVAATWCLLLSFFHAHLGVLADFRSEGVGALKTLVPNSSRLTVEGDTKVGGEGDGHLAPSSALEAIWNDDDDDNNDVDDDNRAVRSSQFRGPDHSRRK
jgi:hypothetical protein